MTNGVGPNPGSNFTPGSHMNGLPIPPGQSAPPNQPGQNFSQPPMPGQRQPLTGNPRGSAGGPGPFPSPTMANSSHNPGSGPHPPQPQPPMMNPLGQSPHLGPRTMQPPPPNGMPGAPGPYPNMNRPPSRTASPGQMGGMLSHRSPSLGPRQPPGMMDPRGQPDPLGGIPQNVINSLREEAGIPAKDVMNMNMDEKVSLLLLLLLTIHSVKHIKIQNRIANLWRSKQQRKPGGGPPNVGAGPSTMNMAPPPGRRTAGGKRNSTSPREDVSNVIFFSSESSKYHYSPFIPRIIELTWVIFPPYSRT
ncbi:hypothetical protein GYMLUDRAFT_771353 [Collybiopsis luxurians FD-317 M1]|uniref:Uncharacterized protein n=1 Tax=Collybiopsis luxurians FD-317 M1 TaxID=944289 RepID=A0A0D0BPQ1_9AGAR|nr:hypothetical protein GYMLUDRAFT_771353 [Collybiopsis luxurians FD-317 M1]